MPPPFGEEELKLRQRARRRLIGAIALVLLLIILLPLVLDRAPQPGAQNAQVHFADEAPTPSNVQPVPPLSASSQAEPADSQTPNSSSPRQASTPAPEPQQAGPAEDAISPPPPAVDAAKEEKQLEVETKPHESPRRESYYVQVGVFTKAQNAKQAQARLAKSNIKARTDVWRTGARRKTRVRIGPFKTRAEADAMLARVKLAGEHDARIAAQKGG